MSGRENPGLLPNRILYALTQHPDGATQDQIVTLLGDVPPEAVARHLASLRDCRLAVDTGRTRPSYGGWVQTVWAPTAAGTKRAAHLRPAVKGHR